MAGSLLRFPLCLILILLCLPLFALVALAVLLRDGRPVLYKGVRLGQNKKPFQMYKFRTLVPGAEQIIGSELLTHKHALMTPFGKFMRDTRLDELPQLFNILKGDMDFVGPRPVRPQVYETACRKIPNYDRRFEVKPGLIGFSQLFIPHSTPKEIRSLIDNVLVRKRESLLWDVYAIMLAAAASCQAALRRGMRFVHQQVFLSGICRKFEEKRRFERVRPRDGWVQYAGGNAADYEGRAKLMDINPEAFRMQTEQALPDPLPSRFKLETAIGSRKGRASKHKSATCTGQVSRTRENVDGTYEYIVFYTAATPLNFYKIHQYFLQESMVFHSAD
jgi:lipopolysaccharide/colanic/teichoic acid biosynthesis glycosyltransferase